MVSRERKLSPEMESVLDFMRGREPQTLDQIVQHTGVIRGRVQQILQRRGHYENGQWKLKELTASGRVEKVGKQPSRGCDAVMSQSLPPETAA